jgi:hypothetical protein
MRSSLGLRISLAMLDLGLYYVIAELIRPGAAGERGALGHTGTFFHVASFAPEQRSVTVLNVMGWVQDPEVPPCPSACPGVPLLFEFMCNGWDMVTNTRAVV